ncbi:MAG: co-chaperone GroES [Candidatus Spechtbacteria bacterium RIFCSPLOWO2_12_FULL_38_22]|uniref:Co-chaperonin GroES n=1 Tax=Candidatus Spechtbacteria bacterium RIFCSPLOWO2_12_FULL_38_22 TaxID=1802165 RepID=A0A1G2HHJ2_9BACT|nr:MAG: co-chaperone GroES [Candidatus Spechtbacteria bacterium RIFCSPHIGHO2_12_FULL_38_30]OGZ61966.1 MAG: co-chaperone GroES [Candidatus Spechtbacteria bacterium RIFCSPLOWO2_12_FULL_38_22]
MIQPLRDNVIIEPKSPEEMTKSGIIIPDTADQKRPEQGTVVAVGPGKKMKDGSKVPLDVKKGDVVLFSKYGPTEIEVNGKEYLIAKEEDILAILE